MKKVLVAEDEQAIREFVVINLKRAGYEPYEASNGEEAVSYTHLDVYKRQVLTGVIASAATRGVQKSGAVVTPKHFAANNQEQNRNNNDSRVSERALREIYLKGFEIVVRDGNTGTIMTSYNKINGIWAASNYDLCTTCLLYTSRCV